LNEDDFISIIIGTMEPKSEATTISRNLIQEGDSILLWFEDESTYLVAVQQGKKFNIHCGKPIDLGELIGKPYGIWLETTSNIRALVLEPTIEDFVMKAKRESGIIYPKDAAILMMKCGIRTGRRVIEVGVGSGSLTTALAAQVAPSGMIYSYDVREDFLKLAEGNLKKAKLLDGVKLIKREGHEPFGEQEVDAIVLDVPEPWREVDNIKASLKSGGRLASLNPTYNQIEQMSGTLGKAGFILIEAQEVLVRGILARPGKTRPEQRMVSHTEFMLFAVRPGG
jgi:tRNA (adenine57-N1/adenine58-N1)-methyltransferase catalytic subunit